MIAKPLFLLALSLALVACQSSPQVVSADPELREPLLAAVAALEGRWEGPPQEDGEVPVSVFQVTSNGSVVRELMNPGSPHEMTNMYTLDGNALAMVHYCAAGNQPRMRATAIDGNRIVFESAGVHDLNEADGIYMGEMVLVLLDEDRIEQHWKAMRGDEVDHMPVFEMRRVR